MFEAIVKGVSEAIDNLRRSIKTRSVQRGMTDSGKLVVTELKKYPSPPPGSRYERTGALGRGWRYEVRSGGSDMELTFVNPEDYWPLVQSDEEQASVHQGRWETIEKIIETNQDRIEELVGKSVDDFITTA